MRYLEEIKILQQLKATGFRPEAIYEIASDGKWSEAILFLFPKASYGCFPNSPEEGRPEVVKLGLTAKLTADEPWFDSVQVLMADTSMDGLGAMIGKMTAHGLALVELGNREYDSLHRLQSGTAIFVAEALLKGLGANSIRRLDELTGREAVRGTALRDADAIISHIEVNRQHGVGVLLHRWFGGSANLISIRSADQFGGRQDFGTVAMKLSHGGSSRDEVYGRVLGAIGGSSVARILCVPYYRDDARTAIALKEISGAPMGTFLMDDPGIPEELMRTLLEKSALRLAISREMQELFEKKYGMRFGYMPPVAPARWIADRVEMPETGERRGAMVGNIWGARWMESLRKTVRDSGVRLAWYANAGIPEDREALTACGIDAQAPHDDEALVRALRRSWFAVLPSGTLEARDDRDFIARRSLPSRLIYMMATALLPVIVLGSRGTAAAKFVERNGIGLIADYDRAAFPTAVDQIMRPEVNREMRERALAIAGKYSDEGAAEWIWKSLARGEPADRRFENL